GGTIRRAILAWMVLMTDVLVVGGGLIGLALARELAGRGRSVTLLEKEAQLAAHQSGHNSGVVHAGLYYRPGSLKARLSTRGRGLLRELCAEHGVVFSACGKVVVATRSDELPELERIFEVATANGVPGIRLVDGAELREIEPHAAGLRALH